MAEVKRDVMRHGEWDEERQRYSDGSERHRCTPKECIKLLEAIYPPYEPEEPTDIYKVMIECHDLCESWEASREMHRTSDPVEAIDRSALMRDDFHITWVERVNPSSDIRSDQRKDGKSFVRIVTAPVPEKPYVQIFVEEGVRMGPYKSMDDLQKVEYPDLMNMQNTESGYPENL